MGDILCLCGSELPVRQCHGLPYNPTAHRPEVEIGDPDWFSIPTFQDNFQTVMGTLQRRGATIWLTPRTLPTALVWKNLSSPRIPQPLDDTWFADIAYLPSDVPPLSPTRTPLAQLRSVLSKLDPATADGYVAIENEVESHLRGDRRHYPGAFSALHDRFPHGYVDLLAVPRIHLQRLAASRILWIMKRHGLQRAQTMLAKPGRDPLLGQEYVRNALHGALTDEVSFPMVTGFRVDRAAHTFIFDFGELVRANWHGSAPQFPPTWFVPTLHRPLLPGVTAGDLRQWFAWTVWRLRHLLAITADPTLFLTGRTKGAIDLEQLITTQMTVYQVLERVPELLKAPDPVGDDRVLGALELLANLSLRQTIENLLSGKYRKQAADACEGVPGVGTALKTLVETSWQQFSDQAYGAVDAAFRIQVSGKDGVVMKQQIVTKDSYAAALAGDRRNLITHGLRRANSLKDAMAVSTLAVDFSKLVGLVVGFYVEMLSDPKGFLNVIPT